jgi:hypothetical protein
MAACAVTLTTLTASAAVGAGPVIAQPTNPAPAAPLTFPTIQVNTTPAGRRGRCLQRAAAMTLFLADAQR